MLVSKKPNISNIVGKMHASELIQTCEMFFFPQTGHQVVNDGLKLQPGGKKSGGNQTGAKQKEAPPAPLSGFRFLIFVFVYLNLLSHQAVVVWEQ